MNTFLFFAFLNKNLKNKERKTWNLPFKMLWKKIKANIHMPCSVQSPPSYAFSSSSDRCLPGSLFCALGLRLNICHCLEASRSKSLLLISPSYFFFCRYTLICLPPEPSLCAWNINEPLWLSWGELCSDSPPLLRVLLLLPVIQKDAEGVKPRCVWCWVRAGYERIQEPKDECKKKKKEKRNERREKNPGWQNLKKKKMSEAPISLNKRLTDGSSLGRWEINTKIIKLK